MTIYKKFPNKHSDPSINSDSISAMFHATATPWIFLDLCNILNKKQKAYRLDIGSIYIQWIGYHAGPR